MNIIKHIFKNNKELNKYLYDVVDKKCKKNKQFNLLISGGNTFNNFLSILSKEKIFHNLKIFLTDERLIYKNRSLSNSFQIEKKTNNKYKSEIFNDINFSNNNCIFSGTLKKNITHLKKIRYAFIGVGDDGHFASIFEYRLVKKKNSYFEIVKNNFESYERITLNENFFEELDYLYIVINKRNKIDILKKINDNEIQSEVPILKLLKNRPHPKKNFLLVTKNCINNII